jgi:16S rRNA (guanine527-N7)-methyltransferase
VRWTSLAPLRQAINLFIYYPVSKDLIRLLQEGLQSLAIQITDDQQAKLIAFVELLHKWNRVYNLTAVRDPRQMIQRHLLDSLSVMHFLQGTRVVDIGAGAGLPGIPLAIALPEKQFVLVDSNRKKTRFLQQAKTELALEQVEVVCSRIENYEPAQMFDSVISRAFTSLQQMAEWSSHLLTENGVLLAMKGHYPEAEMTELANSFEIKAVHKIDFPGLDADRYLIEVIQAKSQNRN